MYRRTKAAKARPSRNSTPLGDSTFRLFLPIPALAANACLWAVVYPSVKLYTNKTI